MSRKQSFIDILLILLPLFAALTVEAHIRHYSFEQPSAGLFVSILSQLLLESIPLFAAHYFTFSSVRKKAIVWSSGFIIYPIAILGVQSISDTFNTWSLFTSQVYLFYFIASVGFGFHRAYAERSSFAAFPLISKLLSLNVVVVILTLGWAFVMAALLASVEEPMLNQPIDPVIDSDELFSRPSEFFSYFLQLSFMGLLVSSVYVINRYVLIRHVLATQGVFGFVAGCLVTLVIVTPVFTQLALWLPLNDVELNTLLPSTDRNIFAPDNYIFCFALLFVSTPVILAFERQKQDKALVEIAQQQAQTELKLLQQQINPHFLFNTLNNLYALTLSQSEKAPDMVIQLSNLLRYTVYEGQKDRVPLTAEINYLQNYLSLQQMRISSQCSLVTTFPEASEDIEIAPLLLIILLENAFKHGVEKCKNQCELTLELTIINNQLTMICSNTLPSNVEETQPTGLGLNNLKRRLKLLYPNRHQLNISQSEQVFTAHLIMDLTT
jgi:sensor histidine kinase YesM